MKTRIYLLCAAAAILAACTTEKADSEISFNPSEPVFDSAGGSQIIGVKSGLDWTASTSDSWITLTPSEGYGSDSWEYMRVTVEANEDDPRTGTITVRNGSRSADLPITQGTLDTSITLDKTEISFTSVGGNASVSLTTVRSWTAASSESWLSVSPSSGTGSESDQMLTLSAAANEGTARSATVSISNGKETVTVSVSQSEDQLILKSTAEFIKWVEEAPGYGEGTQVSLGTDIDLAGVTLPRITKLLCSVNGKGFRIKYAEPLTSYIYST